MQKFICSIDNLKKLYAKLQVITLIKVINYCTYFHKVKCNWKYHFNYNKVIKLII